LTQAHRATAATSGTQAPERILVSALQAFSEKGFDGARTRDIALRANVTLGLLRYHFGSKEQLWKAAVERSFGDLKGGLDLLIANPGDHDDRELLRLLLRAHVRFVAENTEFIRIMHDEGKRRGPRMRWLVDRYVKPLHDELKPLIVRAQKQGILPGGIAPTHFVYVMVGAVGMIFHQAEECRRVSGIDPCAPASVEAHGRAVEALFLGHSNEENA
jgi:TetR/AcrR family transcriptional regulator